MTLTNSTTNNQRARVQILTVDPVNRRIEGLMKDGSTAQVAVWDDAGNAFRWPVENEVWIIQQTHNIWRLVTRVQQGQIVSSTVTTAEPVPIETMTAGQMKLDSNVVIDDAGNTFVAVDLDGIQDGWTLRWDSTLNRFVAGA